MLIDMITYKAKRYGIRVITTGESYTSKASFLDDDEIPIFGETKGTPAFTGKRLKRGLYRTGKGLLVNADINGAANILRKFVTGLNKTQKLALDSVNVWQPRVI